ncbi:type II CRISPR RNA-guided endonuclease Cas9 [Methylobacillus arboreus]|uniref:type II CRISPR RNA-guided endonuclease Cas9 n=1 Tax=Methylobacillus arboreus TaxID=755170 RepID=UPI001E46235A|nr:type II CRISPR RNA-guided endonuclease Cas9 [Methylobacillus arboreus]MCB5191391.1 type II CRISPR RNA-guided endonuclease Cas9 [Methylobacillus arboreus]
MNNNKNFGQLTFGFDIGIASVGWAVLNERRIVDLGVRAFDKAETAKEGESLNLARRTARLMRRRLRRRAWRLTKVARLLKRHGLINDVTIFKPEHPFTFSLWELRKQALDRPLNAEEWARVIYHLCKHRGFHWVSKAEEKKAEADTSGEGGKVKQGLAATARLMKEKGYRTAAEMVLAEFPQAQRNKQGEYSKALSRSLLSEEFSTLFAVQRAFNNPHASLELESKLLDRKTGLFWAQKPALSGEKLLEMLGYCTFERKKMTGEKDEYRAPKASFSAERHVWLTRLNNLRVVMDGVTRPLSQEERQFVLPLPYNQASDLSYKQLKAALVKQGFWSEAVRFTGLSYPSQNQVKDGKAKDPESATLVKIPAFQELRKALKEAGLETEWQGMVNAAMSGDASLLDQIAWVLSIYKDDDEVERELKALSLPSKTNMVDVLQNIRFDKFSNLSLKALRNIVPHMERGLRYDEACIKAGYHHSQLVKPDDEKLHYLPPFYSARDKTGKLICNENIDVPRNPVVLRALNQARKVMNALIKKYGSPHQVNIEMARDLSRPFDERRKIKDAQEEFRDRNKISRDKFNETFNTAGDLKGRDFEKWQLYEEQECKCAYSREPLDIHRLFEMGYVEIDHALPYSRSFDDSKNNRVLVLARENRNKGNLTPYEYLDGKNNSERWHQFEVSVNTNKAYRQAKRSRLLRKEFGEKESAEFRDRNLNDTRYICRFFKNYVEQFLRLAETSESKRCIVLSGQMTAFLRARWGLTKVRTDSDRHHALDAAVVAACSHGMVKRLSDYSRRKELEKVSEGFIDVTTGEVANIAMDRQLKEHFPDPWPHFRRELEARRLVDDLPLMKAELANLGTYSEEELDSVKPLFVSRAPQRRNSGAAHKETIYGQTERLKKTGSVTQKVAVASMSLKDLGEVIDGERVNCKLIDPHRNEKLYAAIAIWLQGKDDREKRAKEIEAGAGRGKEKRALTVDEKAEIERLRALPRKPMNDGSIGPIVRTVTMVIDKLSGISIRHGVAKNDTMLRVDVFTKANKFHLVPVYVHHAVAKHLPSRAIVAFKDEDEWTLIDESFAFCFSLYPNDFVKISQKGKSPVSGYYSSCHRGTGNLNIWSHDRNQEIGKGGIIEGIGVKTALSIEKFNVDVLGNIYPVLKEERRGLA